MGSKLFNFDNEEEIVISGIAGRFPNSNNVKEYQTNLFKRKDLGTSDHGRWNNDAYDMPPRIGKINNIEKFDRQFFDILAVEADNMDPISRMLLEHTYEAIIDAGVNPKELYATKTAVVTAIVFTDSITDLMYNKLEDTNGLPVTGCSKAMLANRISYWLGVTGPSCNIDTACSSSFYAMMEAYKLIKNGECDAAIVGTANLCLHPFITLGFFNLGVLSHDGYCKPFDRESTGYMRSDTVSVLYLQKIKDARRAYATIIHVKINHDGFKKEGITHPSSNRQKELLNEFYKECGVSPDELSFVEGHSTGTPVGDSVEIKAIDSALCARRTSPLLMGSVKSNIGHSEAASGICQIIKVLIAMETGIIPPTIYFNQPRENMPAILEGRIKIVTDLTKWEGGYVGINSFGAGGTNSHLLLKPNPKIKLDNRAPKDRLPRLVAVSGRTVEAVKIILDDVQNRPIDVEYIALLHQIYNDNIENHFYRGYTLIDTLSENVINTTGYFSGIKKPICFIFSGLGTQWFDLGGALIQFSVFDKAIQKCDTVLKSHGISVKHILINGNDMIFDNAVTFLVGLTGLQIGMIDLLKSIDIVPNCIIGHSIGELVCGYIDGCLTIEETILLSYYIGLALFETQIIDSSMAEIQFNAEAVKNMCPSDIDIACYNSRNNFIIAGPANSMKAFLAKLKADKIYVKEIPCGRIPFHTRYMEPVKTKLLEYLNRVLPDKKIGSFKWLNTSVYEQSSAPLRICSPEYYVNYLSAPILFTEVIRRIPKDAVTIEVAPHDTLQHILKTSVETSVEYIALCKHTNQNNIEIFLEGIGEFYKAGLQPRIANLYPEVKFPVSRGTPMISHLVRWDHSKDCYIMQYSGSNEIVKEEVLVNIDITSEDFVYMTGHIVNGKNLMPAISYLQLIWQMIGWVKKQDFVEIPVVFEDVKFFQATILFPQKPVDLILMIQKGSNRFEIIEGDDVIVTGKVRIPPNIEEEKIYDILSENDDNETEEMNTQDIYKELKLRGYQYTGLFRGLRSASITGRNGHIVWTRNWTAFMDNMLQIMILGQESRSLLIPTRINKVVIDPKFHLQQIQNLPLERRQFHVRNYKHLNIVISGGIEIHGIATAIFHRRKTNNPVLEEYKFVAHNDRAIMPLPDVLRMSIHIAVECYNMLNIKIIEFIEESDQIRLPEDLNSPFVEKVLSDIPQIHSDIKLVTNSVRLPHVSMSNNITVKNINSLSKNEKCLMVMSVGILRKGRSELIEQLLSFVLPEGFLLTSEELDIVYDYSHLNKYGLDIILQKRTNKKLLVLLRRRKVQSGFPNQIIHVNNYEFSWVDKLKSIMREEYKSDRNIRITVVAEDFQCGLLGLVNCLRKEPGGELIRSVFIQDKKAPMFSLENPLYSKQLQLDLPINVLRHGNMWGSYKHFPLGTVEPKFVENAFVDQMVHGDLSTLRWVQSIMPSCDNDKNLVNVHYSSVNFRDIMIATGRLSIDSFTSLKQDKSCFIGMEYVGLNTSGQRIMGLCSNKGMTNYCMADEYFNWIIPDEWTMEDAATVPFAYSTCYYALYMKGKMKKQDKILIHSAAGGVGQAAIYLALHEGCEVFVTVGSVEKRHFIRKTFPSIPNDHIGNSRNTSFEQMVMQQTKGHGVDIVLNSLTEEKLQASIRCLAKGGRFLEIGKYDMISNTSVGMSAFLKGISFYGILFDKLLDVNLKSEQKYILSKKITEGLKVGVIKPLSRKIFQKDEIEAAFRYMAVGKHIGKVIIKIRREGESLNGPIVALPRYNCLKHKCYIILGGLGGFGLELANWLILRGAKHIVLTTRNGIKTGYQQSRINLWQSYGVDVQIIKVPEDLKDEDCEYILKVAEKQGPVDAIFNLAVVLNDSIFQNQSPQMFEDSFKSKAWATRKFDKISRKICAQLRHFVVFSSLSSGIGIAGQTNYGMANSAMERICEKRVKEGLHGLAIQWGAIGDVGLVANMQEDNKELIICGTLQQNISSCLNTLEIFLLQDRLVVSSMVIAEKTAAMIGSRNIFEAIAQIMGLKNLENVPQNTSLVDMGMDSMMTFEIKQTLEKEFNVSLTAQDIRNLNFAKLKKMTDKTN